MENLLPIGTVVTLRGGQKKIMIYGRKQVDVNTGDIFDYVACFYPEGFLSDEYRFGFSHSEIENIEFVGYQSEEELELSEALSKL